MIGVLAPTLVTFFIQPGKVDLMEELYIDDFEVGNCLDLFLFHAGVLIS